MCLRSLKRGDAFRKRRNSPLSLYAPRVFKTSIIKYVLILYDAMRMINASNFDRSSTRKSSKFDQGEYREDDLKEEFSLENIKQWPSMPFS